MADLLAGLVFAGIFAGFIAGLMLSIIWISMLVDVCTTRSDIWALAAHDRFFCFCVVFALGPLGAILYGLAVRPSLTRVEMTEAGRQATRDSGRWSSATAATAS